MTEQNLLPPPEEAPEPNVVPLKSRQNNLVTLLFALGFLVLAVAIFYVWQYPKVPSDAVDQAAAVHGVEQRLVELDARLTNLEQRPTVDLGKVTARMESLDSKLADQAQFASRLDTLSGRIESLSARDQTSFDTNKRQLDILAGRVATQESNASSLDTINKSNAGNLDTVNTRLNRVSRLQEASLAFTAGRPIGDLPDAPEALARYAHAAPPTEAQLRLHFPQAEQAALAAQQPNIVESPFVNRVWERAQGLVTIRQGDNLVVGNSSATTLNEANIALSAGDLVGAVNALETLKGQPRQAMANWLTEAKALLDARAALAAMADHA